MRCGFDTHLGLELKGFRVQGFRDWSSKVQGSGFWR